MTAKPVNVMRVSVYLTYVQQEQLQKMKQRTGAPVSELIRRAIDQYVKAASTKRPAQEM